MREEQAKKKLEALGRIYRASVFVPLYFLVTWL